MEGAFVLTWKEVLIGAMVILGVYIAELLLLMYSSRGQGGGLWRRGTQARELMELKRELAELRERLNRLEQASSRAPEETPATPYTKAFHLAKQGLDVAEVAASCGISRAEAELIVAMQRGGHL
ncbi:DUF2802 domain-containing protein [Thiobacter aerophilum]|uniref:DUF2802 domain-containing protein n=1 Tax=Thiobacter aerophilum TaxID=3121275 RepID=A0ABV0EAN3_9BURK